MSFLRKYRFAAGVVMMAILVGACTSWVEDWNDNDLYEDPNQPSVAGINQLFTAIQVSGFFFLEGHIARTAAIWTQQMAGTERQYAQLAQYSYSASDWENEFYFVHAGGGLVDIRQIIEKANAAEDKVYAGIAKVWEALIIGTAASVWGDLPYSEAVNPEIQYPHYDVQEDIYDALQVLLDEAIEDLGGSGEGPGANDFVFGGDADKWIAAAHTLKARLHMHWTEVDPANRTLALAEAQQGISSID
ncbi:MAG: SusD/RagB family nutrient-binding outer membrane lipoprotein, partial [Candidatus Neomarinimicrobiota bacterium]